nr:hypothetical protein GCM10025730_43680 [Promicromonospora thailandica]
MTIDGQVTVTSAQYLAQVPGWSDPWPPLSGLYLEGPHDDTMFEALGSGGFALGVLGLCLLLGRVVEGRAAGAVTRAVRWVVLVVVTLLAAVGALALTVYSAQIVAIWWWTRTYFDLLDPRPTARSAGWC